MGITCTSPDSLKAIVQSQSSSCRFGTMVVTKAGGEGEGGMEETNEPHKFVSNEISGRMSEKCAQVYYVTGRSGYNSPLPPLNLGPHTYDSENPSLWMW